MRKLNRIFALLLCAAVTVTSFGACGANSEAEPQEQSDINVSNEEDNIKISSDLLKEAENEPDLSNASFIELSDGNITVTGNGAKADGGVVTITDGGVYSVSGSLSDGRIIVNAPQKEVTLVLQNANISCSYGSPLYIYKSSFTKVYLAENTENTLSDGENYTFDDSLSSAADEEPNACLYSKSDLVIYGSGRLEVNANYNNGITGKDSLVICNLSVSVTAKNNGINGKDSLIVKNAEISADCGKDALRSTNDTDSSLGYIVISDSSLDLAAGEDGIQAETALSVSGGSIKIISGGGSEKTASYDSSAKGLKAGSDISLSDGTYILNCCDDAVHANGNILISGGTITVDASGDGIDSNGNITVSGGELYISGPTNSGNGAIDYEGSAVITGGTVVAAGASGMAQNFGSESTQGSILISYQTLSGGEVTLKDSSGKTLVSYTPSKNYGCVVISCPEITSNGTYTVTACGQTSTVTMNGFIYGSSSGMAGGMPGGMGGNQGGMKGGGMKRQGEMA